MNFFKDINDTQIIRRTLRQPIFPMPRIPADARARAVARAAVREVLG